MFFKKKILILGNLGYIGSVLIEYLKNKKIKNYIIGFDNAYFQSCLLNRYYNTDNFLDCQLYGDIRNMDFNLLNNVDYVISLAAISNDPMGNIFEKPTNEINYEATFRIAKEAKARGVKKFIFASSCSVYGSYGEEPKNEKSKLNPLTIYAKSKIICEEKLDKIASKKFNIICLRFATACGASPRIRLDLVLNDFIASAILKNEIELLSDGNSWRPLIDIHDMCRAIDWAMEYNPKISENFLTVNTGSNEWNYKIKELANKVKKIIPGTKILFSKNAKIDKRSYKVDFSLFNKIAPKHQPLYDIDSTIIETYNLIKNSNFKLLDFRNSNFIRLNVLKNLIKHKLINSKLEWNFKKN
jgi:nucleoside-diphosphate-sugar epimerase